MVVLAAIIGLYLLHCGVLPSEKKKLARQIIENHFPIYSHCFWSGHSTGYPLSSARCRVVIMWLCTLLVFVADFCSLCTFAYISILMERIIISCRRPFVLSQYRLHLSRTLSCALYFALCIINLLLFSSQSCLFCVSLDTSIYYRKYCLAPP